MQSSEDKIIEAAVRLFSDKGFAATSIRDIANEAGMASSALYYYVQNKNTLLVLIMGKYLKQFISMAKEKIAKQKSPSDQLKEMVRMHVVLHGEEQLVARVVDTEYRSLEGEDRTKISKLRREYEQLLQGILQEGLDKGLFDIKDVKVTSYALLEMCTGVVHWFLPDKKYSIEEVGDQFSELALQMVRLKKK